MAHGQNNNSSHRLTNSTLETRTLVCLIHPIFLKLRFYGLGIVLQLPGCVTNFLCSVVKKCEWNGNGRFSFLLGLAKLTLKADQRCRFSRKDKTV